jgi:hypothetical protein
MKRSEALAPLSRDHHVALAAALRLRRATIADVGRATALFTEFWQRAGARHFEVEEELILTALPPGDAEWDAAVARVRAEHADILARAQALGSAPVGEARELGERLHAHVRYEERVLFALLERRADPAALAALGAAVESAG